MTLHDQPGDEGQKERCRRRPPPWGRNPTRSGEPRSDASSQIGGAPVELPMRARELVDRAHFVQLALTLRAEGQVSGNLLLLSRRQLSVKERR
jgi:hypothetical protein